jgi:hypothetical protein
MSRQETLQIAWIAGMPRSGTTWLSQIFASSPDVRLKSCPLFSYEFKNVLDENSSAEQWDKLFSEVYVTNSEFLDQEHLRKIGLVPTFPDKNQSPRNLIIKSNRFHNLAPHILKLNQSIRFIHIVRHPCATVYSWLSNPREFPEDADPIKEWKSGQCRKTGPGEFWGFDDWKIVTSQALMLSKLYPHRHKIVRYEDLLKDTQLHARDLFEFLKIPYRSQTQDFIELSHSRHDAHKHSVFKNPELTDEWKVMLDKKIVSLCLSEIKGTELEQFTEN